MEATRYNADLGKRLFPHRSLFPNLTPDLVLTIIILQLVTNIQGTDIGPMHEVPENETVFARVCWYWDFL